MTSYVTVFAGDRLVTRHVTSPPVFVLIESIEGGRDGTATGGLPGTVALARSIVTPDAPFRRRCRGSRTPCGAMTGEPLAGACLWSSGVLLLSENIPGRRAIPIPTGCTLRVGHALAPLPSATPGAGMQRGMVHWKQVWCWCRRLIRGHKESDAPLGTSGVSVSLSGTRCCRVRWPPCTAGVHPHNILARQPAWDGLTAGTRLVSPNPRVPRPGAPRPRLW
jgi:hypothetical protein